MTPQVLFLAIVFFAVLGVGAALAFYARPDLTRERLRQIAGPAPLPPVPGSADPGWLQTIVRLSGPLAKLSLPEEGWQATPMRVRFMNAGLRGAAAPAAYFAAKTVLAVGLPGLLFLYFQWTGTRVNAQNQMIAMLVAAAMGYYLPNVLLGLLVRERKRRIFESLPDAIDLMTVCVEAGLGLDAAILRVADESRFASPALADELHLTSLELRAGASKEKALRNFALRTGVEEVDSLVAMLVQAERFGTSIADSLRVHADSLRTKRRLRAEEAAAKIPVKLSFPLIFGIFPAMLIVLAGPAVIAIARVLLPSLGGR